QFRALLRQLLLRFRILRLGLVAERGKEMLPDQIELSLHVAGVGGHHDDDVLLRHHQAELAILAVAAIGAVPRAPELKAVALRPGGGFDRVRILLVLSLLAPRLADPLRRDDLLAVPLALLQVTLADLRDVFGLDVQAVPADRNPLRAFVPPRL